MTWKKVEGNRGRAERPTEADHNTAGGSSDSGTPPRPRFHLCSPDAVGPQVRQRLSGRHSCNIVRHANPDDLLQHLKHSTPEINVPPTAIEPACAVISTDCSRDGVAGLVETLADTWQMPVVVASRGTGDLERGLQQGLEQGLLAMRAGALDFVLEDAPTSAVFNVMDRAVEISKQRHLDHSERLAAQTRMSLLSNREQEIALLLATGLDARQVAAELKLAAKTVENHRAKIMGKLRARTPILMARIAWLAQGPKLSSLARSLIARDRFRWRLSNG